LAGTAGLAHAPRPRRQARRAAADPEDPMQLNEDRLNQFMGKVLGEMGAAMNAALAGCSTARPP
jgi:hypothetical protein